MQVPITQDAATPLTHPTLDQVDAPAALITVGGDFGASEEFERAHRVNVVRALAVGRATRVLRIIRCHRLGSMPSRVPDAVALPIDDVLATLLRALHERRAVVLQAPPGAGKTTRVPLALLDAAWLAGQRIMMLEPRRLAARAAARRMAATLGEVVGARVGFRVRGETRVSARTRIEVVTEGVLTRLIQRDPSLDGVGLVIFDEFHERSIHADLGLALVLQSQEVLRPDLRLLVMSATLDGATLSALLGDAPIVTSTGRQHPVQVRYVASHPEQRVEGAMAAMIRRVLVHDEGGVLAFLPGVAEIRRTVDLLHGSGLPLGIQVHPLYGDLSADAQDAAIAPASARERKVVLATSIAESSLTIDGVCIVVDSGLARVPRFSPRSGLTRLETHRVSRASAEQRCGRAGRTTPGVCYRMWAMEEHAALLGSAAPEILEADLASLALDLAVAGVRDPGELRWLDSPPAASLAQARELLLQLDAIDETLRVTPHGRAMADFGLHPRLAHMLIRAHELGHGATACVLAAVIDERDVLRRDGRGREADLRLRVMLAAGNGASDHHDVDRDALRQVRERIRAWRAQVGVNADDAVDDEATGWLLALAYPDRVAKRRSGDDERYIMRNGSGARLDDGSTLTRSPFLVVADLDGRVPDSRIYLAAPVDRADIERVFAAQLSTEEVVEWDASLGVVRATRRERLGAIVLRESPVRDPDELVVARVVMDAIARGDGVALHWSDSAQRLRQRLAFLRAIDPEWPDLRDSALVESMEAWLLPRLIGLRRRSEVEQLDLAGILRESLTWEQRRALDELAPTHVTVPTGSRIAVDYGDPSAPALSVRLQELFGLAETPSIARGTMTLTLRLLSPARRPVQVTRDLAGFWRSSYFAVRKDLRGRYPKHEWPEDPLDATPTRRAKPRS